MTKCFRNKDIDCTKSRANKVSKLINTFIPHGSIQMIISDSKGI